MRTMKYLIISTGAVVISMTLFILSESDMIPEQPFKLIAWTLIVVFVLTVPKAFQELLRSGR